MREFDHEPVHGLPERLPDGERILWQGAPDWKAMALRVFHLPVVGAYFAGLMLWRSATAMADGAGLAAAVATALPTLPMALLAIAVLAGLALLNARTTVYTITNRRVVMRFGAAFTKAFNIPFAIVDSADVRTFADGAGDIVLVLTPPNKIAYFHLWPHARPLRFATPQPTLRAIKGAADVAHILTEAFAAQAAVRIATQHEASAPAAEPVPA